MRKFLDSLYLAGRQPVIHCNDDGIIWCISPANFDFKIRKLNLDEETEMYQLLVSETGSPVMHNAWFSTLMANAMYARFAAQGCSFCYLNAPHNNDRYINASFRQVQRQGPAVMIRFHWGDPFVVCHGDIGNDIGKKISRVIGADFIGKNGRENRISIHVRPAMRHSSISALCDYVFSCLQLS